MGLKPGYKQTEVGIIPEDWDALPLRNIVKVQGGYSFRSENFSDIGFHVIRISDIQDGLVATESAICHPAINISSDFLIQDGDFLVAMSGATTGKVGVFRSQVPAYQNQRVGRFVVRNKASTSSEFIGHLVSSYSFRSQLTVLLEQGAQPNVSGRQIESLIFPIPRSPREQSAIAEALSDVDALIGALDRLIAKKRDLKQAAMQQLLTGQRRLPGFSGEWERVSFGDVFRKLNSKEYQIQAKEYRTTGILPVVDQGKDLVVGFSDREDKRFRCPDGGVIVFGDHTCIVKFVDFDFVVGADGTQILAAKSGHNAHFHAFELQQRPILPTGYNRHFGFLKGRSFVAPAFEEQTAIAEVLSDMDAEIVSLERRRDKTRALKQGMMQELLTGRTRLVDSPRDYGQEGL